MKIFKNLLKIFLIILLACSAYIGYSYLTLEKIESGSFLTTEINEIKRLKTRLNMRNDDISSAAVGWHLDHILITINSIYLSLQNSDTAAYNSSLNIPKILMFSLDFIPRGRAKALEQYRPKKSPTLSTIEEHLQATLVNLKRFDSMPSDSNFIHPYIGQLNRDETKRFLKIHTEHHLKICYDILNNLKSH